MMEGNDRSLYSSVCLILPPTEWSLALRLLVWVRFLAYDACFLFIRQHSIEGKETILLLEASFFEQMTQVASTTQPDSTTNLSKPPGDCLLVPEIALAEACPSQPQRQHTEIHRMAAECVEPFHHQRAGS